MSQPEYSQALMHPGVRRMYEHLCTSYNFNCGERYLQVSLSQFERGGHSNEKLGPGIVYNAVLAALTPDSWLSLAEIAERMPKAYKDMKRTSLSTQVVRLVKQGVLERRGKPTRYKYRKTSLKPTLSVVQNHGESTLLALD